MRILLVEDDDDLAATVASALTTAGFAVDRSAEGRDAEFRGQTESYDLAILDVGLPGMDGLAILQRWRTDGVNLPVLMLTARSRWHDKLAGFDAGADDYLTKPFQLEELVVRARALIRRAAGHANPRLRCGDLELDLNAARFSVAGRPLALTPQEHRILAYLMHHPGKLVTRGELGDHVYEGGYESDSNVIDVMIGRLRRKVERNYIHTVRGQGFRLATNA